MNRYPCDRVWCDNWWVCGGIDVPGSDGPGGMLCESCEKKLCPEPPKPQTEKTDATCDC